MVKRRRSSEALKSGDGPLAEFLARCSVQIDGASQGTGFFIAPGLILTCAHVVGETLKPGVIRGIRIRWGSTVYKHATLKKIRPAVDEDLALIEVDIEGHPCVPLDTEVRDLDPIYVLGFPVDNDGQPRRDAVHGVFEARTHAAFPREHLFFLKIRAAHIVPGLSGSPMVNLRTNRVVGVMTETRGTTSDIGGWAVPIDLVEEHFSSAFKASRKFQAKNHDWQKAVDEEQKLTLGGTALPHAQQIRNFIDAYLGTADDPEPFGGRESQLKQLDGWLGAKSGPPYLLMTAPAGRGKSALVTRWVQAVMQEPVSGGLDVRVVFVPISLRYGVSTGPEFFAALATRLRRAHGLPVTAQTDVSWHDTATEALSKDSAPGTLLLVVIDGLDEATGWQPGPGTFPIHPGERVRIVISARHTAQHRDNDAWRDALGLRPADVAPMTLPPLDMEGLRDVLVKMGAPVKALSATRHVVKELLTLTEGDPLLVRLYVKELWSQGAKARLRVGDLKALGKGLHGFFSWWWKDQERQWGESFGSKPAQARTVFNVLAAAFGPLERRNLLSMLASQPDAPDGDQLDAAIAILDRFVLSDPSGPSYVLAHPRFATYRYEMLKSDGKSGVYDQLFVDWGEQALAKASSHETIPGYLIQFYGAHLDRAHADAAKYSRFTSDEWRAAWESTAEDYSGFLADVGRASAAAREQDGQRLLSAQPPVHLALQLKCALSRATVRARAELMEPEMLGSIARESLWSFRRALAYVRQLERVSEQARGISALVPFLDGEPLLAARADLEALWSSEAAPEDYAPALSAIALRLQTLDRMNDALRLIAACPHPYARAYARIGIAGNSELANRGHVLEQIVADTSTLEIGLRVDLVRRLTRWQPAIESIAPGNAGAGSVHREEAPCNCWLCRVTGLVADYDAVPPRPPSDLEPQRLKYVVAWVPENIRGELIRRALRAEQEGKNEVSLAERIVELAPFMDPESRTLAWPLAEAIPYPDYAAFAIGALVLASEEEEERKPYVVKLLGAVESASHMSGVDDRKQFFVNLVKAGYESQAVDQMLVFKEGDWTTGDVIAAAAPELPEASVRRLLSHAIGVPEGRDAAVPALLTRLASFGKSQAKEALEIASTPSEGDEQQIANLSMALSLPTPAADRWKATLETTRSLKSLEVRQAMLTLAARVIGSVPADVFGSGITALVDTDISRSWRALEIVGAFAPFLSKDDALHDAVTRGVTLVMTDVPHGAKERHVDPYFRRLGELGLAAHALDVAKSASRSTWNQPLAWCLLSVAEWLDLSLLPVVDDMIGRLEHADIQLRAWSVAARGAVVTRLGSDPDVEAWRKSVTELGPFDVQHRSDAIAMMLDALPASHREWAIDQLLNDSHFEPSISAMPDNQVAPYVDLARHLPGPVVDKLLDGIGRFGSGSAKSMLRAALVPRLIALGRVEQAFELLSWQSLDAPRAQDMLRVTHDGALSSAFDAIGRMYASERYRVGGEVAHRISALGAPQAFEYFVRWMDRVGRLTRPEALLDTVGIGIVARAMAGEHTVAEMMSAIGR